VNKMEIKTSFEIFRENQDFKSSNKKWVSIESFNNFIKLLKLESQDFECCLEILERLEEQLKGE
jgi:hypothetical protein